MRADGAEDERDGLPWPRKHVLLGVPVSVTSYDEAVALILEAARQRRAAVVDPLAVNALVEASRDPAVERAIASFELVTPDGQPVRWALNLFFGAGLSDRVYGPELMRRLCAGAAAERLPIYLYGSTRVVVARLRRALLERFPGLPIVGCESPPFRPLTEREDHTVVERINGSGAGLVFLGLGCPKQELFAAEHRGRILAVQICVGAAFDFLAGAKPMAPRWMQASGLEWLFRLLCEPRRLWRRYLVGNTRFLARIGWELARGRISLEGRSR